MQWNGLFSGNAAGAVTQDDTEAVARMERAIVGVNQRAKIGVAEHRAHRHRPAAEGQLAIGGQTGQIEDKLRVSVVWVHHPNVVGAEGQRAAEFEDIARQRRVAGRRLCGPVNNRHVVNRAQVKRERAGRSGADGVGDYRNRAIPVGNRDKAVVPVGGQREDTLAG